MSPRDVIMSKPIIMYQRSCFTSDGMSIIMHIPSATPSRPLVLAVGEKFFRKSIASYRYDHG